MPAIQSAAVSNYDFGAAPSAAAPAAANAVLKFKVLRGGRIDLTFLNESLTTGGTLHVTAQVSSDDTTYTTVTAAKQETLVSNNSIVPGAKLTATLLLDAGNDLYLRILATGSSTMGVRGAVQIRDAEDKLQIIKI